MPSVSQVQARAQIQHQPPIAMNERNLGPTALAALSGISYHTISKAMKGETSLNKTTLLALCAALAVSERWLLSYASKEAQGGPIPMSHLDWMNHQAKVQGQSASRELLALRHGEVPQDLATPLRAPSPKRRLDKLPGRPADDEEQLLRKQLWARRLRFLLAARKMNRNSIPGLSEQAVYNMLRSAQWPNAYSWKLLSERFGLSVDQLQGLAPISAAEYLGQDIQDNLANALLKDQGLHMESLEPDDDPISVPMTLEVPDNS
jgi:transcriptional regulator with XRE-family HTH domain